MPTFTMQLSCASPKQFLAHIHIVVGLRRDSNENRDLNLQLQVQVEHLSVMDF